MKSKLIKLLFIIIGVLSTLFFILSKENHRDSPEEKIILFSNQNNDDLEKIIENAIFSAKHSLFIQIFSLKDQRIIQALEKKANEGIEIEIIYDAKHNPYIRKNSKIKYTPKESKGLMHRKILVIDKQIVILGSANLTKSSLRMHDNLIIKINSPFLANTIIDRKDSKTSISKRTFIVDNQEIQLWLTPQDKEAESYIISLIEKAQKSINIAMFTFTNSKLASALIKAKIRGVDVKIIVEKSSFNADKIINKFKSEGIYAMLSKKPVLLHHKLAWIDGSILVLGSANWTYSAFHINEDDFIVLNNLTESQKIFMQELWKKIIMESL